MLIVVGMNPSPVKDTKKVRKNSTFDRLYGWMDHLGIKHYSFINVCNEQKPNLTATDIDADVVDLAKDYPKVIALGGFVSDVLKKRGIAHFKLPHPSPRNIHLNSKEYVERILDECESYLLK